MKNGPYLVSGSVPLAFQTIGANNDSESTEWVEGDALPASAQYALCRCGRSNTKPFYDGTHAKIGFDGTETASREPIMKQAELLDGPTMQLADAEILCAFARFCDPHGRSWNQAARTDDPKVGDCASGRLIAIDKETGKPIEPKLPQSIGLVEDPAQGCSGPFVGARGSRAHRRRWRSL